ncbi:C-terminal autoproteolytic domain of nucleoporin nup98, partial [Ramicandelaber brevisporus]
MLNEGSYYTVPSVSDLQLLGDSQLQRVAGFEVGRVGYGSIVYDDAVNLCGLRDRLDAIAGSVVVFDRRSVTVYPESGPVAERGSELNMPATVTLQQCGPSHRNTSMDAHLEALTAVPDTEFIDYDAECAAWTFKVQH